MERIAERSRARYGISRLHQRQFLRRYSAVCACKSVVPVVLHRRTKLRPVSIGRALRVHRSTFCSCNTRPDTDRRAALGRCDRPAARTLCTRLAKPNAVRFNGKPWMTRKGPMLPRGLGMGGYRDLVILESIEIPLRSRVCECERECLNERVKDLVEDWIPKLTIVFVINFSRYDYSRRKETTCVSCS